MSQSVPNKKYYPIGGTYGITRMAVSYTPAADMTLHQFSFVARKAWNPGTWFGAALNTISTVEWEIRTGVAGNKPNITAASLLDSGSFDFRASSAWKSYRTLKFTINLTDGLALTGVTAYYFIFKTPSDEDAAEYVFEWASTYESGAAGEVDAAVYCSYYTGGAWAAGDNSYNLTLYVLDDQAGERWHVVLNEKGYITPSSLASYRCEQVVSGLAQARGGQSEYSQLRYPYSNYSQDDWTTGAGQINVADGDPYAYLYSLDMDTLVPGQAIIGPAVHQTGLDVSTADAYESTKTEVRFLIDTEHSTPASTMRYFAQKFAASSDYTATKIGVRANKVGDWITHALSIALYTDVAGSPGAIMGAWVALAPVCKHHWIDATINQALTNGTDYWVVVRTSQTFGTTPEYRVMFDDDGSAGGGVAKYSDNLVAWTALTTSMHFRINRGPCGDLESNIRQFAYGSVNGTGNLFVIAGKRVYEWDEANKDWDDLSTDIYETADILPANAQAAICFNDKLFVCLGYDYPMRVYDGTDWGPATSLELVENGAFTTDTTDWTAANAVLSSEAGGQAGNCLKVLWDSAGWAIAHQTQTLVVGEWYEFSCYHKDGGGTTENSIKLGTAINDGTYWDSGVIVDAGWTQHKKIFKATGTTLYINLIASDEAAAYGLFDTVTLKEAPVAQVTHIAKGYLWRSATKNTVEHSSTGLSWSSGVTCGTDQYHITEMVNYGGNFLVGKENGIWVVDDKDLAREYTLFQGQYDLENCQGWCVWSGMLFLPVQESIWRWTATNYKEVGPNDERAGPTSKWPNKVRRMAATASILWGAADPIGATTGEWGGLMAYNARGWHHLASHLETDNENLATYVTTQVGSEYRVWFAEGKRVNYVRLPTHTRNRYDWVDADYNLTGGGLITSWWDGGLKDALKFWNRLTLLADIPTDTFIEVYYARDGEDWEEDTSDMHLLGILRPDDISNTGEFSLMFPDGLVAKSIQLIFNLGTNDNSVTPRLRAYNIESAVRQIPVYAHSFRVLVADNVLRLDGVSDTRSADTLWEELQRAAAQNEPIIASFPFRTVRGIITHLSEQSIALKAYGEGGKTRWERVANITVVEAT